MELAYGFNNTSEALDIARERFERVKERITFSVPKTDIDISKMLKGMGRFLGIPKENIAVQDFKESFCHYMFYQPKELWQYEAALFYCDRNFDAACTVYFFNSDSSTGFFLTVIFDLTVAIEVGLVIACVLFMKRVMETTKISVITDEIDPNNELIETRLLR